MYNIFENEKNISGVIHFGTAYKSVEESITTTQKNIMIIMLDL